MKTPAKVEILKNVGSSWFALGVNILAGLFLSPYILHRLGDAAFGLWVLVFSVTGYYGLFDLGIRSSIIRYVAKYSATNEYDQLNRLINTATFTYGGIGLLVLLLTFVGSRYVDSWFRVPPEFLTTARLLFLMIGSSVALGFPLGVFGGILEGRQRFYLLNFTSIGNTALRVLLIILALRRGHGLLMVALITLALPLIAGVINGILVLRILPLHFSLGNLDGGSFKLMANYSATTFLIIVAQRLRFKSDAVVIGTFLSTAAITYFTIGSRLVDYAGDVVSSLAQIFVPMSSQSEATGDLEGLRKILLAGNRACALIIFPIAVILIILGKSVIEAWVGARYVAASYPVLLILLIPSTLMLAQSSSGRILFGMNRHRIWAWIVLGEGVANLILSIALVRRFGIIGEALGTAIPLFCSMVFFLPQHLCHLLKVRLAIYLREAFLLPLILCAPLVAVLLLLRRWFVAHSYWQLAVQLLAGLLVYGAGLVWAVMTKRAWHVQELSGENAAEIAVALIETYQEEA
jgi:O-antigen/teichoic acid export membrane protein